MYCRLRRCCKKLRKALGVSDRYAINPRRMTELKRSSGHPAISLALGASVLTLFPPERPAGQSRSRF
jgi:hypothetical protein